MIDFQTAPVNSTTSKCVCSQLTWRIARVLLFKSRDAMKRVSCCLKNHVILHGKLCFRSIRIDDSSVSKIVVRFNASQVPSWVFLIGLINNYDLLCWQHCRLTFDTPSRVGENVLIRQNIRHFARAHASLKFMLKSKRQVKSSRKTPQQTKNQPKQIGDEL